MNLEGDDRFYKMIELLHQYRWIYDFQLTEFFVDRVWENIPKTWCKDLSNCDISKLGMIPYGFYEEHWTKDLKAFIKDAIAVALPREMSGSPPRNNTGCQDRAVVVGNSDKQLHVGMTPKKIHEVENLAEFINRSCPHANVVVDAGAGMGYLDKILNFKFGYRVLGLEGNDKFTHGAKVKLEKTGFNTERGIELETLELNDSDECFKSLEKLVHRFHVNGQQMKSREAKTELPVVTKDSTTECASLLSKKSISETESVNAPDVKYSSHRACEKLTAKISSEQIDKGSDLKNGNNLSGLPVAAIFEGCSLCAVKECRVRGVLVGLHCCGDLTPTMLRMFLNSKSLRSLVCVSCCYHRMEPSSESSGFKNFPMSRTVKDALSTIPWQPSVYCFRLGAQETRIRWKNQTGDDHEFHVKNVAYRGLIELYIKQSGNGAKIVKERRRVARRCHFESFHRYLDAVFERLSGADWSKNVRSELTYLYDEYEQYFKYIQIITVLQVLLQPVIESLIVTDRQQYLKENTAITSDIIPIFDEMISPRNLALVARKTD